MEIPDRLHWRARVEGGEEWLTSLPSIVEECVDPWELRPGSPFRAGPHRACDARNAPGRHAGSAQVNFPADESEMEAQALAHWQGDGAVRLIASDRKRRALLVERCLPGAPLASLRDLKELDRIGASVLRRWRPPADDHTFRLLEDVAAGWMRKLDEGWDRLGRPIDRSLVDRARAALRDLAETQPSQVECHTDFQSNNVLAAGREPWLAIDPKPIS